MLFRSHPSSKQQLEPDMEQKTGSKLGKEYVKAVYCHPAYLTSMQSTSYKNAGLDEAQARGDGNPLHCSCLKNLMDRGAL